MRMPNMIRFSLLAAALCVATSGCKTPGVPHEQRLGPPYDRPFPQGQVTDSFWETQQANAEASDFVFYDHEFEGKTAKLTPAGKNHLMEIALRLEHVPFPIVVEQSPNDADPRLDAQRRQTVVDQLASLGVQGAGPRVVVAPMLAEGITAVEGEAAYYGTLNSGDFSGGTGRRFSGTGGVFR